ncbi:PTS system mannose/fructose/sorbose family transporter subunit IID [Mucilaginibacter flavus]|uniref:PTS system mannose/fructose/sorbose family transporter subunit IID n=1 Tax=Mucilaginibacter flavus TaxID=931504 RepID=UPI0025B28F58|nr:PTS system mannose/fructose/sorbose family transporter subunit IID [Mucilaginibacter flavus]MDN3583176.1 PTS system mannose/fructose/sorbose family transporter subunit IID [Mucilaginibacter flavus]
MLLTFLLLTLIAIFGHFEDFLGTTLLSRPLVLGPLVGLVLGDVSQGVMIGATLELIFMGNIKVGAAIPPDIITGGVLGTAFAILAHKGPAIALALAVPISILAELVISALFVFRAVFNKKFNQYAQDGDYKSIQRLHILSGLLKPVLMGIIVFISLEVGATAIKSFLDLIPAWVQSGLQVAGNMLPALGFALLMNLMFNKKVAPYFFLGFILAAFLKLPVIAIGGLGVIIALIVTQAPPKSAAANDDFDFDDAPTEALPVQNQHKLSKGILRAIFFRSLTLEANFNFETWQNTGFAFSIIPALKKLYHTQETMTLALKRHLQLFNTSPYGSTLIIGITAAMEEQNTTDANFDEDSISSVKLGLMGPLAGVFDSLFWGTFKVIAAGVGTSLAIKGNILGPILFMLIFNIPHLLLRYHLTFIGYNTGTKFLQNLAQNNVMDRLTAGASILGLMVVGAMPATLMNIKTPLSMGGGASSVQVQVILDQVVPAIIPLALTFLVFYFVKKQVKTTWLLLGLLALGFAGSIIHLFV